VADLRERGEGLIRTLTDRSAQPEEARTFRRGLEVLNKEVEATAAAPIPAPRPSADFGPGRWVRVAGLGREGRVLTEVSPQGTVEVELGIGRVHLPVAALHPAPSPGRPECTVPFFVETTDPISPEINLVGCTVEESSRRLEKYLDAAFLQGLRQVRVIHGKGTGALRKGVHQFLAAHPLVEGYRLAELNEGGSGATVAALKER
jgi:DNA mismatch repair protein MutS2